MKKSITILSLLAGATGVYAQGTIVLGDYVPGTEAFGITIWSPDTAVPTVQQYGNTANDLNVGSKTYTGTPLGGGSTGTGSTAYGNGALWTLAVYAAPGVNNTAGLLAAEATGTPFFTSQFLTAGGTGAANAGTAGSDTAGAWAKNYGSTTATALANFTGGATVQLEAWYNGGVANPANFETQFATSPVSGVSQIESIGALGGTGSPPAVTPTLVNFVQGDGQITSFSLATTVPEPSTIALGVIGASTLLFRRRK
jgi:hypothetical protein